MRWLLVCLFCAFALPAAAEGPVRTAAKLAKPKKTGLPYLGPGADKMSPEEYERVYKSYIQSSILLGYPFLKEKAPPCEQAMNALFRSAGMFAYPVPSDAQQVKRAQKVIGPAKIETYESVGFFVQVVRKGATGALEQVLLINSASPKATRRLSAIGKNEFLRLERDPITGLEQVKGIPVGYPSPFLTSEGQGLYVKVLRFNGKVDGCEPLDFQDNAWVGGFDLSDARCAELQGDAEKVWTEKMSPDEFSKHELERMKKMALTSALAKGTPEKEARALIDKHFTPPLTNEINVVGSAMRNLAQCNLLALGRAGKPRAGAAPEGGSSGAPANSNPSAGSAH